MSDATKVGSLHGRKQIVSPPLSSKNALNIGEGASGSAPAKADMKITPEEAGKPALSKEGQEEVLNLLNSLSPLV